jgi:hypothetical protein
MNTDKDFAPYEPSLALKELGFDEPCFTFYPKEGKMGFDGKYHSIKEGYKNSTVNAIWIKRYKKDFECVAAPLYQQCWRWFREQHDLYHVITIADLGKYETGNPDFQCAIYSKDPVLITDVIKCNTYEEAEQACLDRLIKIVKNK